jgi:hypothetical protein
MVLTMSEEVNGVVYSHRSVLMPQFNLQLLSAMSSCSSKCSHAQTPRGRTDTDDIF